MVHPVSTFNSDAGVCKCVYIWCVTAAHGSLLYRREYSEWQTERDCLLELLFVRAVWLLECKHAGCEVFGRNCPPAFMATLSLIFEPPA